MDNGDGKMLLDKLLQCDMQIQLQQPTMTQSNGSNSSNSRDRALAYLAAWANVVQPIAGLLLSEKVLLLQHSGCAITLLHCLQRSLNAMPLFLLPNDTFLTFHNQSATLTFFEQSVLLRRIQDELLTPMRRLDVQRVEFAALKALLLLQPDIVGLSIETQNLVLHSREALLRAMFTATATTCGGGTPSTIRMECGTAIRCSQLLLLLPMLFTVAQAISNNPVMAHLFGFFTTNPETTAKADDANAEQANAIAAVGDEYLEQNQQKMEEEAEEEREVTVHT